MDMMVNALTEDYYYSLMLNLHLQGDLTESQIDHLIKLKMQLEDCDIDEASYLVGDEIEQLPDREELKKELKNAS